MRKISPQELLALVNNGADVALPEIPKEATQVEGMDHIARHLHALVQTQAALAENQNRMIESINQLTKVLTHKNMSPDLKPLIQALLMNNNGGKQEQYDFEVQRMPNGRISGITAKVTEH